MAKLNIITLGSSKNYTDLAALGLTNVVVNDQDKTISFTLVADGSTRTLHFDQPSDGKNGTDGIGISKIEKIGTVDLVDTYRITFTDNSTFDYEVKNGKNGADGQPGQDGFSPTITENADNTDKIYKLDITTADTTFTTPNLKGAGGSGSEGGEANLIDSISVNGVNVEPDANKNVDITVPTKTSDLSNDSGFLTEHQDISGKVDKVDGKSLIADSEITRLASVDNYDDTQVKTAIQAVANGLMDSVGYSADYKTIDIIAKNGVKKSVNVAPIISHASITELSDVDTTNKATGKALVYNEATKKHEYATISSTDEKVKMDASTDAKYLGELLDNITIANENGELKVKKLDGQEVTITEINYLKGLTMNVMDLVNMFSNGGVKIINTPVATYAELLTIDKSAFIDGISYLVYVLADENHDNAKTTYLVDKDSEIPTYFGFADSQRDFTTNPIDLATEITGKLGISNMDSDAIKALFTVDDTYKTETATNNAFSTHGAKALYDELLLAIGNKANDSDLTAHKDDVNIHVSTTEKDNWNGKADASDLTAHTDDADIHVTAENKATWNTVSDKVDKEEGKGLSANDYTNEEKALVGTIKDKINKTSIVTALDDTVTDEQVASALLAKTGLDKKIDKTSIATELSDASTDDEVVGALTAYNELQKLESANKEQFSTASGDYITVNDSVDGNIIELGVKGNSFQNTYSGKNLFDCATMFPASAQVSGITLTNNGDGTFTLSGTATANAQIFKDFTHEQTVAFFKNGAGIYTLSTQELPTTGNVFQCTLVKYNGTDSDYTWRSSPQGKAKSYNITQEMLDNELFFISFMFYIHSGNTINQTFTPQVEFGSSATEYEAYVGGIPSPNPSYPQTINSVGDDGSLVIKSENKNILNIPDGSKDSNGITTTALNGRITCSGTSTAKFADVIHNISILFQSNNVYTFSIGEPIDCDISIKLHDSNGTALSDKRMLKGSTSITFTAPENVARATFYIAGFESGTAISISDLYLQVEKGDIATLPVPHKETVATIPLSEPLRSIGDIKDEITYQDGKWGVLRRLRKVLIDGDTNKVALFNDTTLNLQRCTLVLDDIDKTYTNKADSAISNKFICNTYSKCKNGSLYVNTTGVCCIFDNNTFANVDEANNWFVSNNTVAIYRLATPVFEPFADQTLPYLSTYDGVTNISNDDALSAEMTVKYPTTDASGVGSRNESRIADIEKNKVDKSSVVTTLGSSSTDTQVPSAKVVYDNCISGQLKDYYVCLRSNTDMSNFGIADISTLTSLLDLTKGLGYNKRFTIQVNVAVKDTLFNSNVTPINDAGLLVITSQAARGSATYITHEGKVYISSTDDSTKSDWTTWKRVCTTTVADVAKTDITFSDETKYSIVNNNCMYFVKNGICTMQMYVTCNTPVGAWATVSTDLPKPSGFPSYGMLSNPTGNECVNYVVNTSGVLQLKNGTTGINYIGTFSYPVAES